MFKIKSNFNTSHPIFIDGDLTPKFNNLTCKVCNCRFPALASDRYTVQYIDGDTAKYTSDLQADAFDCPRCGCQIVVGKRLKAVKE